LKAPAPPPPSPWIEKTRPAGVTCSE
jgi:hypothetical protein